MGEEKATTICACCSSPMHQSHGFIYRNENPYALYFAAWIPGHSQPVADIAIGIAEWAKEPKPEEVLAISLHVQASDNSLEFMFVDPTESAWQHSALLGQLLPREEALQHISKKDFLHIAEHIIQDDRRIRHFLG
jgi:hypothetical protein